MDSDSSVVGALVIKGPQSRRASSEIQIMKRECFYADPRGVMPI
jgi:hypothetical protein